MKDDRDGKWFGGVSAPRKKAEVEDAHHCMSVTEEKTAQRTKGISE